MFMWELTFSSVTNIIVLSFLLGATKDGIEQWFPMLMADAAQFNLNSWGKSNQTLHDCTIAVGGPDWPPQAQSLMNANRCVR